MTLEGYRISENVQGRVYLTAYGKKDKPWWHFRIWETRRWEKSLGGFDSAKEAEAAMHADIKRRIPDKIIKTEYYSATGSSDTGW